jgi:hypothetical protein
VPIADLDGANTVRLQSATMFFEGSDRFPEI